MQIAYIRNRKIQKPKGPTALEWMTLIHAKKVLNKYQDRMQKSGISKEEIITELLSELK
jgi:hypothetical protein